jgi:hypothetical protein
VLGEPNASFSEEIKMERFEERIIDLVDVVSEPESGRKPDLTSPSGLIPNKQTSEEIKPAHQLSSFLDEVGKASNGSLHPDLGAADKPIPQDLETLVRDEVERLLRSTINEQLQKMIREVLTQEVEKAIAREIELLKNPE